MGAQGDVEFDFRQLEGEVARLRASLRAVKLHSLLEIRRAAFGPTLGVRYSEAIRDDICAEIKRLEEFVDEALATGVA